MFRHAGWRKCFFASLRKFFRTYLSSENLRIKNKRNP